MLILARQELAHQFYPQYRDDRSQGVLDADI